MHTSELVDIVYRAMIVLLVTSAPTVIAAALVGVVFALIQAATQLQDQSLTPSAPPEPLPEAPSSPEVDPAAESEP